MKRVELYARVRDAVMIDGLSQAGSGSLLWDRSAHGQEDTELFGPRRVMSGRGRLYAQSSDPFIGVIDRILEEDKESTEEATAHIEADLRAAA